MNALSSAIKTVFRIAVAFCSPYFTHRSGSSIRWTPETTEARSQRSTPASRFKSLSATKQGYCRKSAKLRHPTGSMNYPLATGNNVALGNGGRTTLYTFGAASRTQPGSGVIRDPGGWVRQRVTVVAETPMRAELVVELRWRFVPLSTGGWGLPG